VRDNPRYCVMVKRRGNPGMAAEKWIAEVIDRVEAK
jgi:hypothetical protein